MPPSIYLASQSPRRQSLLSQMGQGFVLLLPDTSEDVESLESTQAGESPLDYVQRVTALKLNAALNRWRLRELSLAPILCADTTVALGSEILGKPQDRQQARDMENPFGVYRDCGCHTPGRTPCHLCFSSALCDLERR